MHTAAILVAAGPGTRLKAGVPKAFVPVGGVPLFVHALRALAAAPEVSSAVVVVPPSSQERSKKILAQHGPWRLPIVVTEGGSERHESVQAGLARLEPAAELVAIHDAARPFVPRSVLAELVAAAARHGAAIPALPATDTVKLVDEARNVASTLPRAEVWMAQTPQVFRVDLIREAHAAGRDARNPVTDDATLVERMQRPVRVVRGTTESRKITTPEDLAWAEWRLAGSPALR